MTTQRVRLTSLVLVEERLREADYFSRALSRHRDADTVSYHLNAFLSAARSVTFILQKVMSGVPEFADWWRERQEELSRDKAARFFLNLRNLSQHEGRVSLTGSRVSGASRSRWTFRFAGNPDRVPPELLNRDAAACCVEHVAKLAILTLKCCERFPYHVSARRALTSDGIQALGLSMGDICAAAGLPREWVDASAGLPQGEALRIIRESVDDLDFRLLRRLAKRRPKTRTSGASQDDFGEELLQRMVTNLEGPDRSLNIAQLAGELVLAKRLKEGK